MKAVNSSDKQAVRLRGAQIPSAPVHAVHRYSTAAGLGLLQPIRQQMQNRSVITESLKAVSMCGRRWEAVVCISG